MRKSLLSAVSVAVLGTLLCSTVLAASDATTTGPGLVLAAPARQAQRGDARRSRLGRPRATMTCPAKGMYSFLGADGGSFAAGDFSAVLGGYGNEACAVKSGIGAGEFNIAESSASLAFIGGGFANVAAGEESFVGAGTFVSATGDGSVVGGGGLAYTNAQGGLPKTFGTIASGEDSFIGAGDLNQVKGNGSFIGAGGSSFAAAGNLGPGNFITGDDSFIGSGDLNEVTGSWSFVGGGQENLIDGRGSFIGGGGYLGSLTAYFGNTISNSGADAFIGAGDENNVGANDAFIGAGLSNHIAPAGTYAAIAGGDGNTASGTSAAVAGGAHNSATGTEAAIGGGSSSSATGHFATIPGGYLNAANGTGSFAAGTQAKARHDGTFVWSDNAGTASVQSTAAYQFVARASGGFHLFTNATSTSGVMLPAGSGTWASLSDRNAKTGIAALDDAAVLAKVAALPVSVWSYSSERGVRHVGPMAQDFYAAFRVGADDRHITSIDEDGVALAAIKALHSENGRLRERLARDDARLEAVERTVAALVAENRNARTR